MRTTSDIFHDHLALRARGDLETDLDRNYSDDIVLMCEYGTMRGKDAMRASARKLALQLPEAEFEFPTAEVSGQYAFLVWKARSDRFEVEHGADSFVIRDGRIVAQTIFYRLARGEIG